MQITIINEDILDDREPHVLVQRYLYPKCDFLVLRKRTSPDEEFAVSPNVLIEPDFRWRVSFAFDAPTDPDDEVWEVFAEVYLGDDNPPIEDPEEGPDDDPDAGPPYAHIVFDQHAHLYRTEAHLHRHEALLDGIAAPTLQEAIDTTLQALAPVLLKERYSDK